ncbi:hypothetical protein D7Y11_15455 [Corallococcus sp. AB018]|uniref:hypothetical protein n=1 Tax=Corallococcus sp. AB018 TaxID=2316715 RepID=UPI000F874BAB|nr:hypothetical protein [Corallococcus sp. AB018]RUO92279.1 hypothetical protein D7Y11_15455 [Corallococcus sp. AB018]
MLVSVARSLVAVGGLAALVFAETAFAQDKASADANWVLSVDWTIQQKEDGKISQGYHVNQLTCTKAGCSLLAVTLNQCLGNGKSAVFVPKIERWDTSEGTLSVTPKEGVILLEQSIPGGRITQRLTLSNKNPLKLPKVIGYSGGFTKESAVLKKVISVEYVPLEGATSVRAMDCRAELPGVADD